MPSSGATLGTFYRLCAAVEALESPRSSSVYEAACALLTMNYTTSLPAAGKRPQDGGSITLKRYWTPGGARRTYATEKCFLRISLESATRSDWCSLTAEVGRHYQLLELLPA